MNHELVRKVADAVLYEGYMLYPYRPSAIKNRQRWTFGILYPPAFPEVRLGTERNSMHSECLAETTADASVRVELRFLHLLARQVERANGMDSFETVSALGVDDELFESWDEALERSVVIELANLNAPQQLSFRFPASGETEPLHDRGGRLAGRIARTQHEVRGTISVSFRHLDEKLVRLVIDVFNDTALDSRSASRNSALLCSLLSAHSILTASGAQFVSLLDPPEHLREAVDACRNVGNFPVLAGDSPERDMMLCSPIVLYDYPQVAPESASSFFDATEMDEMLTLRVMTLTDEEKCEMRRADSRVRELLDRTEQSARQQLARTHGVIRSMHSTNEES